MTGKPNLDGYVDVAQRLRLALACHPELRVVEQAPDIRVIGDRAFIEVNITVWRNPDDPQPVNAHAWEPFPGRTPFTRDSEQMNAATSALGRALGYMGFGIDRGIATADEVKHRQDTPQEASPRPVEASVTAERPTDVRLPTPRQLDTIHAICRERGQHFEDWTPNTAGQASEFIEALKMLPKVGA